MHTERMKSQQKLFSQACRDGNVEEIQRIVKENNIDVNRMYDILTPLGYACENGHKQVIECLIDLFGSSNIDVNKGEMTPLMYACWINHVDVIRCLVKHFPNIDANKESNMGWTVLSYAFRSKSAESPKTLLELFGLENLHLVQKNGNTLLYRMCWNKVPIPLFEYLFSLGIPIEVGDALVDACQWCDDDVLSYLLNTHKFGRCACLIYI